MSEIKTRLRRIADYIDRKRGRRLTVLFRTADGVEQTGTVDDLIAAKGTLFGCYAGTAWMTLTGFCDMKFQTIFV